jgi:hypothetical protein
MHNRIGVFLIVILAALSGCGHPTIDGSSDEALKSSVAKVRSSLPEAQRSEFDRALMAIAFDGTDLFKSAALGSEVMAGQLRSKLDGKTGEDILAAAAALHAREAASGKPTADQVRAKLDTARAQQLKDQIAELESKRDHDAASIKQLALFTLKDIRIKQEKIDFLGLVTTLTVTVRNDTSTPVSTAIMIAKVTSEGRSIPWVVEEIGHKVPGGVEPGEEKTWELMEQDGGWRGLVLKPDMRASLEVTRLYGPNDVVFASRSFSMDDQAELDRLRADLAGISGSPASGK